MRTLGEMYGDFENNDAINTDHGSESYRKFKEYFALHWSGENESELWAAWSACWGFWEDREKMSNR